MKKLPCGHCGTGIVRVRNLKARGSLEHGSCECKSRLCGTRGVKMYKPANLREHKGGRHRLQSYQCDPCGLEMWIIRDWKTHKKRVHGKECCLCGKSRRVKAKLKNLNKRHTMFSEVAKMDNPLAMIRKGEHLARDLSIVSQRLENGSWEYKCCLLWCEDIQASQPKRTQGGLAWSRSNKM